MEFSRLRRRPVVDAEGRRLGRIEDVVVRLADPEPRVSAVLVRVGRGSSVAVDWTAVGRLDEDRLELSVRGVPPGRAVADDELFLGRDVLDTQVFDIVGRHLSRTGDIQLALTDDGLRVIGVEVGLVPVARRLGLGAFIRGSAAVDWHSIRLISRRGQALQLASDSARILAPHDIAEILGRIPADRGTQLLSTVSPDHAAEAVGHARPRVGAQLLAAAAPQEAARLVDEMPRDDAAAVLRHVPTEHRDAVLDALDVADARTLRDLLEHPVITAGGLMNPDVLTAPEDEPLPNIRERISHAIPRLDALLTVVVLDTDGRPVGAYPPRLLLGDDDDAPPLPVSPITATTPASEVIARFATHDALAVPVVDGDGRLIGVVAVDDVFEELLVDRLPGRRRFHLRRRRQ